jgi:hypothetical protein
MVGEKFHFYQGRRQQIKIPGFTAEASVYKMSGHYQSVAMRACSKGGQKIISQLPIGPFRVSHGFGLFDGLGSWFCRLACDVVYAVCLEGCEGTPENPKGSTHCIICDENYRECLKGCGPTQT